jgi:acyl-coenzyme A thioesterase PaaI-like protein
VGDVVASHYRWCVGCGADHPAGLHMRVVAGEGMTMESRLEVGEFHQGAPGLAHGGIIATAMDEAMGVLNRLLLVPAVTVHLEVDYVRPVPVGSVLHIRTSIVGHVGRKIYTAGSARLDDPEGPEAVNSAALFLQVPLDHFVEHGNTALIEAAIKERPGGAAAWRREVNP